MLADVRQDVGEGVSEWLARPGGWQILQFGYGVLTDPDSALDEAPCRGRHARTCGIVTSHVPGGERVLDRKSVV